MHTSPVVRVPGARTGSGAALSRARHVARLSFRVPTILPPSHLARRQPAKQCELEPMEKLVESRVGFLREKWHVHFRIPFRPLWCMCTEAVPRSVGRTPFIPVPLAWPWWVLQCIRAPPAAYSARGMASKTNAHRAPRMALTKWTRTQMYKRCCTHSIKERRRALCSPSIPTR